jgi:hypothetical protein|tara:strand:+ start:732 stop:986 length:255 start_codon:yes stop_codon:yes gene_type:complete
MPAMITLAKYLAQASAVAIKRYRETGILPSFVIKPKTKPKIPKNMFRLQKKNLTKKKPKAKPKNKISGMGDKYKQTPKKTPRSY